MSKGEGEQGVHDPFWEGQEWVSNGLCFDRDISWLGRVAVADEFEVENIPGKETAFQEEDIYPGKKGPSYG